MKRLNRELDRLNCQDVITHEDLGSMACAFMRPMLDILRFILLAR